MKKLKLFISLLLVAGTAVAQQYKLAEAADHYKTLQQHSSAPSPLRAWMDTIQYPPSEYGNSIVYMLVKTYYLSDKELVTLSESVKYPANSSDQVRHELDYMLQLQETRTPGQIARVELLANIGYWPSINMIDTHPLHAQNLQDLFFEGRELMGEGINAKNFPKISKLLQGIMQDMRSRVYH